MMANLISSGFLLNQYWEFSALMTMKFSDSVYSCRTMSVLGLHRSHVFFAWLWIRYNISMRVQRKIRPTYNPGYVNMVTYIHFTDAVWVRVIGLFYL